LVDERDLTERRGTVWSLRKPSRETQNALTIPRLYVAWVSAVGKSDGTVEFFKLRPIDYGFASGRSRTGSVLAARFHAAEIERSADFVVRRSSTQPPGRVPQPKRRESAVTSQMNRDKPSNSL
jgi:hypothetical protein